MPFDRKHLDDGELAHRVRDAAANLPEADRRFVAAGAKALLTNIAFAEDVPAAIQMIENFFWAGYAFGLANHAELPAAVLAPAQAQE